MLSMVFFALSLSLDAIGVGLAYGLKKIKILPTSWLFRSLISLLTAFLAVALGKFFYQFLFLRLGIKIGTCFTAFRIHESFFSFLPGTIMIFLAILRLFG